MTDEIAFPPLRDLPPGRVEARKRHLLGEIGREPARSVSWRSALVVAVAVVALAGASVAIAAGLGAFNGLSRVQHPLTAADVLGRKALVGVERLNAWATKDLKRFSAYDVAHGRRPQKPERILPHTARLLGELPLPGLGKVYAATDTHGNLCIVFQGGGAFCSLPFSRSNPVRTYESAWWGDGIWGPVGFGIVMDGIPAVSFKSNGREVTVPVHDNLWYYIGRNTAGYSLTLHLANGTAEVVRDECGGQCGSEGPVDPGYPAGLPTYARLG